MKLRITLTFVAFILGLFTIQAQSVDEIVANHIKAIGGTENWKNLKTLKITGSVEIGPNMKAPVTIYLKDKKKMRFEMDFQGMKMIQAIDGDSGWSIVPFSGKTDPERMSEEDVRNAQEQADFTGDLFDYKSKGSTVEFLGKEDMEGSETFKMKVTKKNNDVKYIYLDTKTYLIMKETSKQKFQDKEIEGVSLPSDYKMVSGMMWAFSNEMRGDEESSQGQVISYDTVEVNPVIDNGLFTMPK
jgi:hypothetical protein